MRALIRKELRELVWPTIIAAACFAIVGVLGCRLGHTDALLSAWFFAMPVVALLLGSHAVAKERGRRTLEWQGLWPASRAQWWFSKLLAHFLVLALGSALVGLAAYAVGPWQAEPDTPWIPIVPLAIAKAGLTFLLFALGFLMSSIRKSSGEAFGLGLLAGALLAAGWYVATADVLPGTFGPRLGLSLDSQRPWAIVATGLALGMACLIAAGFAALSTLPLAFRRRSLRGSLLACALIAVATPSLILGGIYLAPAERPDFGKITDVSLSPDGRTVAFLDDAGPYGAGDARRLWVMNADGSGLRCVARGPVWRCEWLPDNRRLVCEWGHRLPGFHHLLPVRGDRWWWLVDAAGGPSRKLPLVDVSSVTVSPRGTYLAGAFHLVSLEDPNQVGVLGAQIASEGRSRLWAWAEDESALYLVREPTSYTGRPPTARPSIDRLGIPSGELRQGFYKAPPGATLSTPEGQSRWIVLSWKNPSRCTLVALDGSGSIPVPGAQPFGGNCISPDGRYAWLHDGSSVFVVDLQARKVARRLGGPGVLDSVVPKGGPYFSPDGRGVAFRAVSPTGHRLPYVTSADGSAPLRPLLPRRNHTGSNPVVGWTADGQILLCYDDRFLAKLSLDGRETDLLVAPGPRREEPHESAD